MFWALAISAAETPPQHRKCHGFLNHKPDKLKIISNLLKTIKYMREPPKTKQKQQKVRRNGIMAMGDGRCCKQGYSMRSNAWND